MLCGGEAGIRTLGGRMPLDGFQDRSFKPLSHLSNYLYPIYNDSPKNEYPTITHKMPYITREF